MMHGEPEHNAALNGGPLSGAWADAPVDEITLRLRAQPPGVYRYAGRVGSAALRQWAHARGWHAWQINGAEVVDKQSFLSAMGHALRFPRYYGHNWDALEDCLTDLAWLLPAAGSLLIYEHPRPFASAAPADWQMALTILHAGCAYWAQKGRPFYVLLRHTYGSAPDLPLLR